MCDLEGGGYRKYGHNESLFDQRRFIARIKTTEKCLTDALYMEDCALMTHTENNLQVIINKFAEAC